MTKIQKLAGEYLNYFEGLHRKEFWSISSNDRKGTIKLKHNRPDNLYNLVKKAHKNMLPDDYKYEFIYDSLIALRDNENIEDARKQAIETDIYTSYLFNWISSSLLRLNYVNKAIENMGYGRGRKGGIIEQLSLGQSCEREEVFNDVLNFLDN